MFLSFKRKSLLVLMAAFSALPAFAEVEVGLEPYAGYGFAGTLIENSSISNASDVYNGFAIGGRANLKFNNSFFIGPDVSYLPSVNYEYANSSSSTKPNPNLFRAGLTAGVQLAGGFRVWGGYNFIDRLSFNNSASDSPKGLGDLVSSGTSFKFGAGFSPIEYLSVNLEYIHTYYNTQKQTLNGATATKSLANNDSFSGKMFLVSVSAPISLPLN